MHKEVNIVFLADCSSSMAGKPIQAVNRALQLFRLKLPQHSQTTNKVKADVLCFSDSVRYIPNVLRRLPQLTADGGTDLTQAYHTLDMKLREKSRANANIVKNNIRKEEAFHAFVLLSDGLPNDDNWTLALKRLERNPLFKNAARFAVSYNQTNPEAIEVLKRFTGSSKRILTTFHPETLLKTVTALSGSIVKRAGYTANSGVIIKIITKDIRSMKGVSVYTGQREYHRKKTKGEPRL